MEFDKICEYFGYFILVIFLIYIFCNIFSIQTNIVEGLSNRSKYTRSKKHNHHVDPLIDINKNFDSILEKLHDFSRIDKYQDEYKKLASNISEYVLINTVYYIRVLGTNISNGEDLFTDKNQKLIDQIKKIQSISNLSFIINEYVNDHNRETQTK